MRWTRKHTDKQLDEARELARSVGEHGGRRIAMMEVHSEITRGHTDGTNTPLDSPCMDFAELRERQVNPLEAVYWLAFLAGREDRRKDIRNEIRSAE